MPKACACNDFNRAQLLRKGVAAAGRGLPNIEPGMPIPAGTGMDRRTFMLRSAGAALSVYGASMLGVRHFEEGIAKAAEGPAKPVLVSIFMEGGWDAMSVLAPIGDARYTQLRPTLALKEGEGLKFTEDERLMWHPQAEGLATLHGEGKVSVLPAVGYDPPDESHFTSRHYWEVGQLDTETRSGWMGRSAGCHRRRRQSASRSESGLQPGSRAGHDARPRGSRIHPRGLSPVGIWRG